MTSNCCIICLDDEPEDIVEGFCLGTENHGNICKNCVVAYVNSKLTDAVSGLCPTMYCPCEHEGKNKRLMNFKSWTKICEREIVDKYQKLASSVLLFLCGSCHCSRSLLVTCAEGDKLLAMEELRENLTSNDCTENDFRISLNRYCSGEWNVNMFYDALIQNHFTMLQTGTDQNCWNLFKKVLMQVDDVERRANLQMRHLRSRPRIWTTCCNREHCYRCVSVGYHIGKSCEQNSSRMDGNLVNCPSCSVMLSKGDGCNAVTCYCGKSFSWTQERNNMERSQNFIREFPQETHWACANVLCGSVPGTMEYARAWQQRHRVEVTQEMLKWWAAKYHQYPTHYCVIANAAPQTFLLTEGARECCQLWKSANKKEFAVCEQQRSIALRAPFLSLVQQDPYLDLCADDFDITTSSTQLFTTRDTTTNSIRHRQKLLASVAVRLMQWRGLPRDCVMSVSCKLWVKENTVLFEQEKFAAERRSAMQFLYLYGSSRPKSDVTYSSVYSFVQNWDVDSSNKDLKFTNNETTVTRPGSVSCYPSCVASFPADLSICTVVIDNCAMSCNSLSIGVAKKPFAKSSSNGVGRTANSWGLLDDRSKSCSARESKAYVVASGREVERCRKFEEGDVVTITCDAREGWCDISVTNGAYSYDTPRFDIPPGSAGDFIFAMTFANDHTVSIVPEGQAVLDKGIGLGLLNQEHNIMFHSLRRYAHNISTGHRYMDVAEVEYRSYSWEKHCSEHDCMPELYYDTALESIKQFMNNRALPTEVNTLLGFTWNKVLDAVCWGRVNFEQLQYRHNEQLSAVFYAEHGDGAPFMAAAVLSASSQSSPNSCQKELAQAFMKVYPYEMHDWYDYNASLADPMIEGCNAPSCRCLPRHTGTCPTPCIDESY